MKRDKIVLILVTILIVVVLGVLFALSLKADDAKIRVIWEHYPNYGSADAVEIRCYEVGSDTVFVGSVPVNIDSLEFMAAQDSLWHVVGITAVDLAGNESKLSNLDSLFLEKPDMKAPIIPHLIDLRKIE